MFKRLAGARVQLPIAIPANLGYRFYAHHLNKYYTCDWALPARPSSWQLAVDSRQEAPAPADASAPVNCQLPTVN
jgi:hypothetical protein